MSEVATTRRKFSAIDGVLLLDKAIGISSNRALQQARHLFGAAKAGHTGTLDPLCSGLLPVCFGEATKFSAYQLGANKRYEATLRLGITTTTGDAEGEVLQTREVAADTEKIATALAACRGPQLQIPPMYSALKRAGKPLYEYARAGIELDRGARPIEIFELRLLAYSNGLLEAEIYCSKGTYIRVLAEKIGDLLGCGAHLTALRRTASGDFSVADAKSLQRLEEMPTEQRCAVLLPIDSLLRDLPAVVLSSSAMRLFVLGQSVPAILSDGQVARVYGPDGQVLGIATVVAGKLAPKRLLATAKKPPSSEN